jgi:hypothetical protein
VGADVADPASVLADPAWLGLIDMAEPVCLIFGLVLSLMPARQAREVVAAYADRGRAGQLRGALVRAVRRRGAGEAAQ